MKILTIALASIPLFVSISACKTTKNSDSDVKTLSRPYTENSDIRNGVSTKYTILYSMVGNDIKVEACNDLAGKNMVANSQNCEIELGTFTAKQIANYKAENLGGKKLAGLYVDKKAWEDQVLASDEDMKANPTIQAYEQQKNEDVANLQAVMQKIEAIETKMNAVDRAVALMADVGLRASSKDRDFFGSDEAVILDFLQFVLDTVK